MTKRNIDRDDLILKVAHFVGALSWSSSLLAPMAAAGYSVEENKRGWHLLEDARRHEPEHTGETARAIKKLTEWETHGLLRMRKILSRLYPEQEAFVFEGYEPVSAESAAARVQRILERLDALEKGPAREASVEDDRKVIATLAVCGLDQKYRDELRQQVAKAKRAEVAPEAQQELARARDALRAWYDDWSTTALVLFVRPGDLIKLGLAKRKPPQRRTPRPDVAPRPGRRPASTVCSTGVGASCVITVSSP